MDDEPLMRAEVLAPYEHPYRTSLPKLWGIPVVRRTVVGGAALSVTIAALGLAVGMPLLASSILPVFLVVVTAIVCVLMAAQGAWTIAKSTRRWDAPSELGAVRARRPHAGDADARVAHAEFAVTVEDTGELFVWRFVPLAVDAPAPPGTIEVPGRPRWGAELAERVPFDTTDTVHAAEQLVTAQARAAELELAARQEADGDLTRRDERDTLAAEAAAAALPLRHLTGQSARRRSR